MSEPLPTPLREALREPFSDGDLARLWPSIERRRARASTRTAALWITAAAVAGSVAFALGRPRAAPPPGPLRLASGAAVATLDAPAATRVVALSDRSRITLSEGARVEPVRNDASAFDTSLPRGRVRFDVQPHGPRRWSIDCGLATVRVVGTSFVLERSPARLHVEVFHGLVRVEGPRVPDGARLLSAGQSIDVLAAPVESAPAPVTPVVAPGAARVSVAAPSPRAARAAASDAWRALAAQREFQRAYEALGPGGAEARARDATADDLLALGEVAHRSRHYAEAAELYARFITAHGDHAQAGMVAFTLGRLQLDQLASPADAARSLDRAQRLGVARYLQEDLAARLVEARARSGDAVGARAAAEAYLRAFPDGRRAADVRRWAE